MNKSTTSNDEILDLVDLKDRVIGQISYSAFYQKPNNLGYIRGSVAFIQNKEGKLWIPRRVKTKKLKPRGLDFSVAEHVSAGENYLEAIVRGFKEELNMIVDPNKLQFLGKLGPDKDRQFFTQAYIFKYEKTPKYNQQDFYESFWLTPDQILLKIKNGDDAKDALAPLVRLIE